MVLAGLEPATAGSGVSVPTDWAKDVNCSSLPQTIMAAFI